MTRHHIGWHVVYEVRVTLSFHMVHFLTDTKHTHTFTRSCYVLSITHTHIRTQPYLYPTHKSKFNKSLLLCFTNMHAYIRSHPWLRWTFEGAFKAAKSIRAYGLQICYNIIIIYNKRRRIPAILGYGFGYILETMHYFHHMYTWLGNNPIINKFSKTFLNTVSKTSALIPSVITTFGMTAPLYFIPVSPRSVFTIGTFVDISKFHDTEILIQKLIHINLMHCLSTKTTYSHHSLISIWHQHRYQSHINDKNNNWTHSSLIYLHSQNI